jgi:hypothetical protein
MGKDGSKWRHDWEPLNAAAAALKAHRTPHGTMRPMQRQPRLSDVKAKPGSFLPTPSPWRPARTARTPKAATVKPRKQATPAQPAKKTTEERVHAAIRHAAANSQHILYKGDTVPISDVRDEMARAGVTGEAFDTALLNLQKQRKVTLYSSSADRMLTPKQKTGGLRMGGREINIVTFG